MCLKFQTKIQLCFENTFEKWADIVSKRTLLVFLISLVFFILMASGMGQAKEFEDQNIIWTPKGNPTLVNRDKKEELFPVKQKYRIIDVILVANDGNSLLTPTVFDEMNQFEKMINQITEYSDTTMDESGGGIVREENGRILKFEDFCIKRQFRKADGTFYSRCTSTGTNPLAFFFDIETNSYDIDDLTEETIVDTIQRGIDSNGYVINVGGIFKDTTPATITQVSDKEADETKIAGSNNLEAANVARYQFVIAEQDEDATGIDEKMYFGWEEKLQIEFRRWETTTTGATFYLFTIQGFSEAIVEDITFDFQLILFAIILVATYTMLFLGNFSPVHCRCIVPAVGLLTVMLAYLSGFGICYYLGGESTGVHQLMPFLLIGIGVDDMFVLCNAIDQTDLKDSSQKRIHAALGHAGPAITITSLTNCLAFAFGGTTSLQALSSFCIFAAVCILMLYLLVMTVFLAVVVWDTNRVARKGKECCGACACDETSLFCCGGKLTSQKQRDYCDVPVSAEEDVKAKDEYEKADPAIRTVLKASNTERCLGKYYSPYILSKAGRIIFPILYVLLITGAALGTAQVEIQFDIEFFVSKESEIVGWYDAQKTYYNTGFAQTETFVDDATVDWSSIEAQEKIIAFNTALQDCTGCAQKWHIENTLDAWYPDFSSWYIKGGCEKNRSPDQSKKTIPVVDFYPCLDEFMDLDETGQTKNIVRLDSGKGDIKGWRQFISMKAVKKIADEGPQYLEDIRAIEDKYGWAETFSYSDQMLDFEQYVVLVAETALSIGLSICAVFLVVIFITGSLPVTILVVFAVALVDLFLLGLLHYWDLTMNNIIVVNLVIGLGLSVDYSAHIAHTYLVIEAPKGSTVAEMRMYKARVAVSQMGSSVLHGGLSTFLAIIVLSAARSYIFVVFFKLWFGIIVFGMANGFILLPVILSFVGPTPDFEEKRQERVRRQSRRMSQLDPASALEFAKIHGLSTKDLPQATDAKDAKEEADIEHNNNAAQVNATHQPLAAVTEANEIK